MASVPGPMDFLSGLGPLPKPYDAQQQVISDRQQQQGNQQALQMGALKLAAIGQQQQQEQQYQTDVQSALHTGNFADLYAKYPDRQKALQAAHDALDEPAKRTQERDLFAVSSYIKNGAVDSAKTLLQRRIDADKAAGQPADDDQQMLDALNSGDPNQVKAAADMALYAVLPEDKRAEFFGKQGEKNHYTPLGDGRILDQSTGAVSGEARRKFKTVTIKNANGTESIIQVPEDGYDAGGGDPTSGGGSGGSLPTSMPAIVDRIATIEGTGQNPRSSSTGIGQFTNATWLGTYKSVHPNTGMTDAQILQQRSNPDTARQMLGVLVQNNAQALSSAGVAPTADNIYLANFLGAGGAVKALSASPDTPINQVVSSAQIASNPETLGRFKTVGQLRQWSAGKMATGAANSGASRTPGQPEGYSPRVLYTGATSGEEVPDSVIGADYLKRLPPGRAALVQRIINGDAAPPKAGTKFGTALAEDVSRVDPSADDTTLAARRQARMQFTGAGKAATAMGSYNRFAAHLNSAWENHLELGGANLGPLSGIAASISQSTDPAHVKAYETELEGIQGEFQKLTKMGVADAGEANRLIEAAKPNQSEAGRAAALQSMAKLVLGAYQPMLEQWHSAFPDRPLPVDLSPATRSVLANVMGNGKKALPIDHNGAPYEPRRRPAAQVPSDVAAILKKYGH